MADKHDAKPTQKTRPKKGEPMEIPVPTRENFLRDLEKVAPPVAKPKKRDGDTRGR